MRWSLIAVGVLAALLAASVVSLVALSGGLRSLTSGPLVAEIQLHELAVPSNFRVDRTELTDALLRQIELRAGSDVGLRMSLDEIGRKQLTDLIIPRLINPSVVARVIEEVEALTAVLGIADYRSAAEVNIVNRSAEALNDVVLMAPSMIRVQDASGNALPLLTHDKTPTSVRLGSIAAHETLRLTVWLSQTVPELRSLESSIRVGAADGLNGSVHLFGHDDWLGRDLEVLPWSRWVVAFVVVFSGAIAAAALLMLCVSAVRGRSRRPLPQKA